MVRIVWDTTQKTIIGDRGGYPAMVTPPQVTLSSPFARISGSVSLVDLWQVKCD
ncbi:MAG: hypothetical protein F6J95_031810 [Leptolyngbya sp. SIO1E4]|nr:hypothetical protein [Leptolyngbya sp. SIO1E4]